jgi:hypothetical protein
VALFQSSSADAESATSPATNNQQTQQTQQSEAASDQSVQQARGTDLFLFASLASIAFSMFEYYVKGDTERALFVGQWPQTILAMAIYLRDRKTN